MNTLNQLNITQQQNITLLMPKNSGLNGYTEKFYGFFKNKISKTITARGEDIPYWVSLMSKNGKKAIGITGEDLLNEWIYAGNSREGLKITKVEWKDEKAIFNKPALCLIGPTDWQKDTPTKCLKICICNKYRYTAERYLQKLEAQGYIIERLYINGSLENTCLEGLADMIIDIVYTGKSFEKAGLKIIDVLSTSDFVIIEGEMNDN